MYELAGDILNFALGAFLESLPSAGTQFGNRRFGAFLTLVFGDTVQVMDGYEDGIAVAVVEFEHLLQLAVDSCGDQSAEASDTMVAVYDVVAGLELVDLLERQHGFAAPSILAGERHAVVALEYLMVGVAGALCVVVYPAGMQRTVDGYESYRLLAAALGFGIEDGLQTVGLFLLVREDVDAVSRVV